MKNDIDSSSALLKLGFYPQHYGFGYLARAISTVVSDPTGYYSRNVDIFDVIEHDFGVPRPKASRCMHYSITMAWYVPENNALRGLFPLCKKDYPPSVTEFICRIAMELRAKQAACPVESVSGSASGMASVM